MENLERVYEDYIKSKYKFDAIEEEKDIEDAISNNQYYVLEPTKRSLRKGFIVLGREGLYFRKPKQEPKYVPWTEIKGIYHQFQQDIELDPDLEVTLSDIFHRPGYHITLHFANGRLKRIYSHRYKRGLINYKIAVGSKAFLQANLFWRLFFLYWQSQTKEEEIQLIKCPNCGVDNVVGDDHCFGCGTKVEVLEFPPFEVGEKQKVLSIMTIPEDFNGFLDKFSEIFLSLPVKLPQRIKFSSRRVELTEDDLQSLGEEITMAKYEYKAKGQKMFIFVDLYFLRARNYSIMDIYYEAKLEGTGIISKRVGEMITNIGHFTPEKMGKNIIKALNEALDTN